MRVGNGYTFNVGRDESVQRVYIIDHVTPGGQVAIQVCAVEADSNFETQGDSPLQWIYVGIADLSSMIDHKFYSLVHGKSYMKEIERFK